MKKKQGCTQQKWLRLTHERKETWLWKLQVLEDVKAIRHAGKSQDAQKTKCKHPKKRHEKEMAVRKLPVFGERLVEPRLQDHGEILKEKKGKIWYKLQR